MPLPTLVELSRDAGPLGQVLSGLEDWMLRAADRFAQQTWEAERKRNNPKRLPFPDPWQYLRDAPAVSEDAKHVLRAAQSQLYGFRRLARVAARVATYNTDWYAEAAASQAADNEQRFAHCIRKVSDGLFGYEPVRRDMEERALRDQEFNEQMDSAYKERRRRLAHHERVAEIELTKPLPRSSDIRREQELAAMLVDWWVRCGNCPLPGLMFFGSKALWVLLSSLSVVGRGSKLDGVKKLRQQPGLIPVSEETPFVWSVVPKRKGEIEWEIRGEQRDGKQAFSFSGRVFFDKTLILPSESVPQSCP